jgi:hypothetical protein
MTIKIIYVDGTEEDRTISIGSRLKTMQSIVGGYLEHAALPHGKSMLLNEEEKLLGFQPNVRATEIVQGTIDDFIIGNVIICDTKELQ